MNEAFLRTGALLGEGMLKLKNSRVAVFGLGGVGGEAFLSLVRSGIYNIDVFDNDIIKESNLNRQALAYLSTVGRKKTSVAAEFAKNINPDIKINTFDVFYLPENADSIDLSVYDYIIDAIDTVAAKTELIKRANSLGVPIISVMGTGNKLNPQLLKISDIYSTSSCPLCRTMRHELRKCGIQKLNVVWSSEEPIKPTDSGEKTAAGRPVVGSAAFVPPAAGIMAAAKVINDLIK